MSTQKCDWNITAGLIREVTKLPVCTSDNCNTVIALVLMSWEAGKHGEDYQSIYNTSVVVSLLKLVGQSQVNIVIWGKVLNSEDLQRELHFSVPWLKDFIL